VVTDPEHDRLDARGPAAPSVGSDDRVVCGVGGLGWAGRRLILSCWPGRVVRRAGCDRPGHDRRYSLSSERIRWELGWEPRARVAEGLERTVEWYRDNEWWWGPIRSGEYREYYERRCGRALSGS